MFELRIKDGQGVQVEKVEHIISSQRLLKVMKT